jgi:hypothetical protein
MSDKPIPGYVFNDDGDKVWEKLVVVSDEGGLIAICRYDDIEDEDDTAPPVIELGPTAAALLGRHLLANAEAVAKRALDAVRGGE